VDQLGLAAAVAALAGGALAAGVGFNARAVGERLSLYGLSGSERRTEAAPHHTPLVGGLVVAGAVALGTSLARPGPGPALRSLLLWYAAVVVGLALIGLADDRFGLSPWRSSRASGCPAAAG
jgi:UDP-N-acetylmuramyl pentapeptide phosphotransferase/UDP-N-acetylglucosamine-1-phosphate transferase